MITMKKSLIALAVLGAFSGAAFADGSNVQLYGTIDLGITHYTGIAAGGTNSVSTTGLSSGVNDASAIGIKGTEDLGGGLSALFDVETGFCAAGTNQGDNVGQAASQTYCTGGGFMQRQSYAGLAGGFGTVLAGRLYHPGFNHEAAVDPFGDGTTGQIDNTSVIGQLGLARASQVVAYVTPTFSGFSGIAAYSFAPSTGTVPTLSASTSNVPRAVVLDGAYGAGPITGSVTYTQVSNAQNNPTTHVNDGADKLWVLTGSYDFGVAKLGAVYQRVTADYTVGNENSWMLGGTVPVGAGAFLLSYSENNNSLGVSNATADTSKQVAVGYTYNLSKRTSLYTSYAHLSNDAHNAVVFGDSTNGFDTNEGQNASGFAAGITMQF
jgi:predicted porin